MWRQAVTTLEPRIVVLFTTILKSILCLIVILEGFHHLSPYPEFCPILFNRLVLHIVLNCPKVIMLRSVHLILEILISMVEYHLLRLLLLDNVEVDVGQADSLADLADLLSQPEPAQGQMLLVYLPSQGRLVLLLQPLQWIVN